MDVVRSQSRTVFPARKVAITVVAVLIAAITVAVARLKPASIAVDRSNVVIETVKSGPMTREVRGSGVLAPETTRLLTATTDARVERVIVQPGTVVTADTIILDLADAQQQQAARDAEWQLRAADAQFETLRAQLESQRLDTEAAVAQLKSEAEQARLRAEADAELERQGLAASITRKLSQSNANALAQRVAIEEQRLRVSLQSRQSQLAAQRANVEQRRAMFELQRERSRSLSVRAGIDGVVQQIAVQVGQSVTAGTTLARVAQTDRLKAELRVADTQAKDVAIGEKATIDTRNGIVNGKVSRVDPAVTNGTVVVDITLTDPLPAGARPDFAIDGTIELDRIADAIYIARPVSAQENATGTVYRVSRDHGSATRTTVQFGRASSNTIEIRRGLVAGDEVIVSDTSAFDTHERISLK
jgi:HlyD family secretion protein